MNSMSFAAITAPSVMSRQAAMTGQVKAAKPAPEPVDVPLPVIASFVEAPVQAAAPAAVDYPTLQKAVLALAGKSREAAAAIAASFGVKTFKELTKDKWADALEAVNERLAILEA